MRRIGVDLDNTLICYDALFLELAKDRGLVAPSFAGDKRAIRDAIRLLPDGESAWTQLQADAYGSKIMKATPAPGALEFIRTIRRSGLDVVIISHKTEWAAAGAPGINLRDAARAWLRQRGFLDADGVPEDRVYFEGTRADKIGRIASLGCTHFIDDLREVFDDPQFPKDVERLLFSATATVPASCYRTFSSFAEIARELFGR